MTELEELKNELNKLNKEKHELVREINELEKRIKSLNHKRSKSVQKLITEAEKEAKRVKTELESKPQKLSDYIINKALSEEVEDIEDVNEVNGKEQVSEELTSKEEVINLLQKEGKVSFSKLVKVLTLEEEEVENLAHELEEEGKVVIINPLIGSSYLQLS